MTKRTTCISGIIAILLLLWCALPASAVSTITVSSTGNGGYLLLGVGMDNVAALDINITYDTATLANPQVTAGEFISGAMMAVNSNLPGAVRMGIITTSSIKGNGIIATLVFDRIGASSGKIIALKASISNSDSNLLSVQTQIINPPHVPVTAATGPGNEDAQEGAITPPAQLMPGVDIDQAMVIGGVFAPSGEPAKPETRELSPLTDMQNDQTEKPEVVSRGTESVEPETKKIVKQTKSEKRIYTQKSVLIRFRELTKIKSLATFTALFDQEPLIGFSQDPLIVLSDGKTKVRVTFIAMASGKDSPDIKVKGATLVSLRKSRDNTNTWTAELKPEKKTVSTTLIVVHEKVTMEFPVTVAPKADVDLDASGAVTEADFKLFLGDSGTKKKPRFDVNGDGKRDFLDDYIFTANYLAKKPVRTDKVKTKAVR